MGSKVTLGMVAAACGVSPSTVSRILNGTAVVSPEKREAVDKAIADGTTLEEFRRDFDRIVARYGWDYNGGRDWRTRVIYETNLNTSYAAGRWEQLQAAPFWQYEHADWVENPRHQHLA